MKKTVLGFDLGTTQVKVAVRRGGALQLHTVPTPENLVQDGRIQTPHLMTDFLKELRKELRLPKGPCTVLAPESLVVCRTITLPVMTEKQLELNLPFEFSDYISDEAQKYVYDYAVQSTSHNEDGTPTSQTILAAAMSKEWATNYNEIFRNAGFRLRVIVPQEMALTYLIRQADIDAEREFCIVNLAHCTTEIYFFRGKHLQVVRSIPVGGAEIDRTIAEYKNVDMFVARTYKQTNYNGILEQDFARDAFGRLSIEVIKAINFYRFNNRDSGLDSIAFIGGGGNVPALCQSIAEANGLEILSLDQLLPALDGHDAAGFLVAGTLLQ